MQLQVAFRSPGQISLVAEKFLDKYHPSSSAPTPIEDIIDLQLQMDIIPIPGLKDASKYAGLDIDAFISSDFKSISVDRNIYESINTRYRFSLAHEIGHMFLHKDLYSQHTFDRVDKWIEIINKMPLKEREWAEWQANQFAKYVLVPAESLKSEFPIALKEAEERLGESLEKESQFIMYGATELLAKKFCVSANMMGYRLKEEKLEI